MFKSIPIKLKSASPWTVDFRNTESLPNLKTSRIKAYVLLAACALFLVMGLWAVMVESTKSNHGNRLSELKSFIEQNTPTYKMALEKNQKFAEKRALTDAVVYSQTLPLSVPETLLLIATTKPHYIRFTSLVIENQKDSLQHPESLGSQGQGFTKNLQQKTAQNAFLIRMEGILKGDPGRLEQYKRSVLLWKVLAPHQKELKVFYTLEKLENKQDETKFNLTFQVQ